LDLYTKALTVEKDDDKAAAILEDIVSAAKDGYCTAPMFRLEAMGDVLDKWASGSGSENWALAALESVLHETAGSLHETWADILGRSSGTYPAWSEVLEAPAWEEFKRDVTLVKNFGTSYWSLLKRVWAYASVQPADARNELAIRLAEEILDGRGMCEQGKMTRLTNVLYGFHPELVDVSVLSDGEALQNRMSVISKMPLAERRAAAEAAFAELTIGVEDRSAWLEALMDE
jgi:hypothetical protein